LTPPPSFCAEQRHEAAATCEHCGQRPATARQGRCAGKVRDPESRTDTNWFTKAPEIVVSFRVAQVDDLGNVVRLVPAELRGASMSGALHENDEVCVAGGLKAGLLRARRIQNLTDGSVITARRLPPAVMALAVVLLVLIAAFVVYGFVQVLA
jgi:hypothetical protein